MKRKALVLLVVTLVMDTASHATVSFGDYTKVEFAPTRGQLFSIPLQVEQDAIVNIQILSPDGDPIRTLRSDLSLKPGRHVAEWDGKDDAGLVVPDEAYVPVIRARLVDGTELTVNPGQNSGGEMVEELDVRITSTKDIAYSLPAPSRVLIRAGIKGGPMLRSLAAWAPRGQGKNVQRWDGRDQDGLIDLRTEKGLTVLVTAFQLPHRAIITVGNKELDYREYRRRKGFKQKPVRVEDTVLARGDTRISRHHYYPPSQYADPKVEISLPPDLPRSSSGHPIIANGQSVPVRVDIPALDRWLMDESLYEVAFFVNHVFAAEEEQGYVPLTWLWAPQDLSPGPHILSANISGFSGKVGVASLRFEVHE